eukprot:Gregarina_sp_Poly_1__9639@NODE_60_length_16930_cov_139_480579_g51_i0_p5_GENE_NODE_60_length_16930_cov_139_480579_g51_i0NODE_60_length_16930_cov_139_480579_g51_i0_p5_ORF_typecomplete_len379_score39_46Hint/PF01079_20/2_9e19Vint/PF14623_6/0_0057Hom_end_hint/PF05203_16/0_08_NODE_60_length_16930_cov_139_480579_g51_i021138
MSLLVWALKISLSFGVTLRYHPSADSSFLQINPVGTLIDSSLGQKGSNLRALIGSTAQVLLPSSCIADMVAIGSVGRNEDDYPFTPNCGISGTADMSCFHGEGEVRMLDGSKKKLKYLRKGDELAPAAEMSTEPNVVLGFLHNAVQVEGYIHWLKLSVTNRTLILSRSHLLPVNNSRAVMPAYQIQAGRDRINVDGKWQVLNRRVEWKENSGLYAPLTTTGWISVNGFLASIFSELPPMEALTLTNSRNNENLHDIYMSKLSWLLRAYRIPWLAWILQQSAQVYLSSARLFWSNWVLFWQPLLECRTTSTNCAMQGLPIQPVPILEHDSLLEIVRSTSHQILWCVKLYVTVVSGIMKEVADIASVARRMLFQLTKPTK